MENDILKEKIINRIIGGKQTKFIYDSNCWGNTSTIILSSGDFIITLHKHKCNEFMKHDSEKTNPPPSYTIEKIMTSDNIEVNLNYKFKNKLDKDFRVIELIKNKFEEHYQKQKQIRENKELEEQKINEELLKQL